MEQQYEEEPRESQKDISTKFLDMILDDLKEIEFLETCMARGCGNLEEYIQNLTRDPKALNYVRVENMAFLIQKFEILIPKIKDIIKKGLMEKIEKKLTMIKKGFEEGVVLKESGKRIRAYHIATNQQNHTTSMRIDPLFPKLAELLTSLRADVLSGLKHILHSQKGVKQSGQQIE